MPSDINLSALCDYAEGRIAVTDLDLDSYISTENMMQNKEGICQSSGLPTVAQTQAYQPDDVLVSNIRPYFRKIWFADRKGGCSNDVLVMRAKEGCYPRFLYYVLSNNAFFDYATATGKGTKMPRGDKGAIMRYSLPNVPYETQVEIADTLAALDERIAENRKINHHLEQMAQVLFDESFPFIANGNSTVGEFISPKRGRNLLSKDAVFGDVPVVAGGLNPSTFHDTANTVAPVITISASGANAGFVNLWNIPVWSSDSSYIDSQMTPYVYFWYVLIKRRQKEIYDAQTGSAQPHIYPQHIKALPITALNLCNIKEFNARLTPIFRMIGNNTDENKRLVAIRDSLLPHLMSGELSVADLGGSKR